MTATINDMDYRLVDILNSDQLEVGDLIGLGDDVVQILSIRPSKTGIIVEIENEFGEKDFVDINDDEQIGLYILE